MLGCACLPAIPAAMNFTQLKTFVVLAECLNVTETAEKLFCSQPSVSIKIKKLEDTLGVTLFDRSGNRLHLTEQGKIFRRYAQDMLHLNHLAREHIHRYDDPAYGKISIGASHFTGTYFLPHILAEYKKTAPDVEFSLNILSSRQLLRSLDNRDTDLLVMSDRIDIDTQHYHCHTFYPDESVLVVSPQNPLAGQNTCTLHDLLPHTFLIKPSHSETYKFLAQHLGGLLGERLTTMEISTLEAIKQCVMNNLGISVISRLAVKNELAGGQLIEIKPENLTFRRGIRYIHRKDKLLSPAAQRFLSLLKNLREQPT